jgi:hypothetical protein
MLHIDDKVLQDVAEFIKNAQDERHVARDIITDLLIFSYYGQKVHSQFGLGLMGFQCRQTHDNALLTVKITEGGLPLVGFITSANPTGCMSRYLDLLEQGHMTWAKDRYPWI